MSGSNLITLSILNQSTVLNALKERYEKDQIYSFIGKTLLAINPYKQTTDRDLIKQVAHCALNSSCNQSIIANGESGAGKTVSTKIMLDYLCDSGSIGKRVTILNPILEAFGNAVTLRNNNSSRFGKYITLYYNENNQTVSADIKTYLLEKVRVSHQNKGEQSFHVFHMSISELNQLEKSMKDFGFTIKFVRWVFQQVSACKDLVRLEMWKELQLPYLSSIAISIGWEEVKLLNVLTSRTIKSGSETIRIDLGNDERDIVRDSLVQSIYSNMFDQLCIEMNKLITIEDHDTGLVVEGSKTISILDIFGFEVFDKNGLEQLCINYTNEKLQNLFNQTVISNEQILYQREGVSWNNIRYPDNKACIKMFESRGLFSILNDECIIPKGSDKGFYSKIQTAFSSNNRLLTVTELGKRKLEFTISHYAGDVKYRAHDFIYKNRNRDYLGIKLEPDQTHRSNKKGSLLVKSFVKQLSTLVNRLNATEQQYIRCIKSNDYAEPDNFDTNRILEQLKYGGVVEAMTVARSGYPVRMLKEDFNKRYAPIDMSVCNVSSVEIGRTTVFMKQKQYNKLEDILRLKQISTIIRLQSFFRSRRKRIIYLRKLDAAQTIRGFRLIIISKRIRSLIRIKLSATRIIDFIRMIACRNSYNRKLQAIGRMQSDVRSWLKRLRASLIVSSFGKMLLAKSKYRKKQSSALIIQKSIKRKFAYVATRKLRKKQSDIAFLKSEVLRLKQKPISNRLNAFTQTNKLELTNTACQATLLAGETTKALVSEIKRLRSLLQDKEKVNQDLINKMGKILEQNATLKYYLGMK